ncbi:MAG: cell division protein ZapD [Leptothrix sp. (in: b-proteobacteria)]
MADFIDYEYPLNESVRTQLRLESLFDRLAQLLPRDAAIDHHHALATLFEVMDVAARADLKSDLLQELDRQRQQLATFRGNPSISEGALDQAIRRIELAHQRLHQLPGKAGQALTANDWLMGVRSRIGIPGGTCSFDLPGYYAWQQERVDKRRADLQRWVATIDPLEQALRVNLGLLREGASPQAVAVRGGQFQQSLAGGRPPQLARLRLERQRTLVPEMSGNRLMLSVRLMRAEVDGRLKPALEDLTVQLALCA